jgi:Tfp pilus assembly protein PilF
LSRAEEALNARDAAAATTWLRQALAHPRLAPSQHVEAELLLARAARLQEQPDAALAAADRAEAVARAANDGAGVLAVLRERSALAVLAGRTDVAAADLAAWESLAEEAEEPQLLFEARVASARLLLDRGNPDRALERLSLLAAEARGTDLRSAYLAVAEVWLAKGDANRAVAAYAIALGAAPEAADALVGRAKARLQAGQADGARADLAAAVAALPRMPSSLQRDLAAEAIIALQAELQSASAAAGETPAADDPLAAARAAVAAGKLEDARGLAESAIMRDRNSWEARALLAEIYLQQGEYGGAANTFATLSGQAPLGKQAGDSRYPSVGGTLAQGLLGVEVYDVEGFAENWRTLAPTEQAALRAAVAGARLRGAIEETALPLVAIVEAGVAPQPVAQPESRP